MPAKTVPDFNLLALKIPQVLFLTRTSPSFFSFLELGLQSCRLEKQPSPGACIMPTAFPGGDSAPCIDPDLPWGPREGHLLSQHQACRPVGLEKPQC